MKKLLLITALATGAFASMESKCNFNYILLTQKIQEAKNAMDRDIQGFNYPQSARMQVMYAEKVMTSCPVDSDKFKLASEYYKRFKEMGY